ncbi:MAG: SWIM zinc finger family protein [Pseudarcicella sp.]|nr:SWIM zinc finger family protein [Pseudarcicella sp.]MBP6410999.1 SWIM zinc finger family protein [Pseudarcicella sp.]
MISEISQRIEKYLRSNALPAVIIKGKSIMSTGACKTENIDLSQKGEAVYKMNSSTGVGSYTVTVSNWNGAVMQLRCTCKYTHGGICKHKVAALLTLNKFLDDRGIKGSVEKKDNYFPRENNVKLVSMDDWALKMLADPNAWKLREGFKVNILSALNKKAELEVTFKHETCTVILQKLSETNEVFTSCTCSHQRLAPLCEHKLASFLAIREAFGFYNTFEKMKDYTQEKNDLLKEYGFTADDDIADKFTFSLGKNGSYQLVKIDETLQKLSEYQQWRNVNNEIFRSSKSLYQLDSEVTDSESRNIFYLISFEGKKYLNDIKVEIYTCKFSQSSGKMTYIKAIDDLSYEDLPIMTPEDNQISLAINALSQDGIKLFAKKKQLRLPYFGENLVKNDISADSLPVIEQYINAKANELFKLLADKPVYLKLESYVSTQNDIAPITVSKDLLIPYFKLTEDEEYINFIASTFIGNEKVPFGQLQGFDSFWSRKHKDNLYKLYNAEVANLMNFFPKEGMIRVKKTNFSGFFQEFVLPVSEKYHVDLLVDKDIVKEELEYDKTKIYLKEENLSLLIIPVYEYEGGLEFSHEQKNNKINYDFESITILERNKDEEAASYDIIKSQHPFFESQTEQPCFVLEFDEVMKDGWLFSFFESMKQNGIAVLGTKDLKKFRYNPNKAKFTMKAGSGIDWFDMQMEMQFGEQSVSIKEIQKAIQKKQNYIELPDGTLGLLPEEWIKKYEPILKFGKIKGDTLQLSKLHFSLIEVLGEELNNEALQQELYEKKQKLLNFKEMKAFPMPSNVNASQRDYQVEGFKWLNFLDEFSFGGILADDMGLGKTLQMLTFLQEQVNRHPDKVNLVVLPTTLIFNWLSEAKKFTPDLKLFVHRGGTRERKSDAWGENNIILTTYGMVRSDIELFRIFPFNYIVLDESQAIKNPDSLISKAVRLLEAKNKLVMTGTPVENNTFDLYSQMEFINPGLLGSAEFFRTEFANPIDKLQDKEKALQLRKIVYPFMLKRTKEEVAKDLPDKTESIIFCEMGKKQRKVYDHYRELYRQKLVEKMAIDGREKASFLILEALLKLRQICDSPALLSDENVKDTESAKLEEIIREIEENAGHHKILIFSQFLKMLDLIRNHLDKHKIKYEYLDGKTTDRAERVNNFQGDDTCRVFLMSLKAGGVGLNLTEADYVYLVDPWWNPAVEQQAIDRTHRIGQKKNVFAYRMICKDTIEEKILLLQDRKRDIAKDIISTEDGFLKKLSQNDIIDLFN